MELSHNESPPPYSPRDPSENWIQPPLVSANSRTSASLPHDDPFTASQLNDEVAAATLGASTSLSSGSPSPILPVKITSHRITLQPHTNPNEIQLPSSFAQHEVAEQDWFTFRNHLFPSHLFASKSQKANSVSGRDEKASARLAPKDDSPSLEIEKTNETNGHDEDFIRRKSIYKVVKEWNVRFFEPRGLLIIAKVLSSSKRQDVNSHSVFGKSILSKAAARGDYAVVEELLLHGADPDIQPFSGSPAIYHAASNRHASVVDLLLQHGAKTDSSSVLHHIASKGDLQILNILLKYGADPNHKSWTSSSPLLDAALRSDVPILKALLAYGADPNYTNTGGNSALYNAIKKRDSDVFEVLLDYGADPNVRPWSGQPCLHLAISQGDVATVKALLATNRVDIDLSTNMTHTPLGTAIASGNIQLTRLLLDSGASIGQKTMGSQSPVFLAASTGNVSLLRLLLEKYEEPGASINDSPPGFPSPLCMAIHRQDLPVAQALLEFGVDPDSGNPLTTAMDLRDMKAIELLLLRGADPNLKPTGRHYPYYEAAGKSDAEVLEVLLKNGARVDMNEPGYPSALFTAAVKGDDGVVKLLLEAGASPGDKAPGGLETVASFVSKHGSETIKALFQNR